MQPEGHALTGPGGRDCGNALPGGFADLTTDPADRPANTSGISISPSNTDRLDTRDNRWRLKRIDTAPVLHANARKSGSNCARAPGAADDDNQISRARRSGEGAGPLLTGFAMPPVLRLPQYRAHTRGSGNCIGRERRPSAPSRHLRLFPWRAGLRAALASSQSSLPSNRTKLSRRDGPLSRQSSTPREGCEPGRASRSQVQ